MSDHSAFEKNCVQCSTVKPVSEFAKSNKAVDGYQKTCFACSRARKAAKRTRKQAINDKCKECIYDPIAGDGTWRQQVADCTSPSCPLFDWRPLPRRSR